MLSRRTLIGAAVVLACALGLTAALFTRGAGIEIGAAPGGTPGLRGPGARATAIAPVGGARRAADAGPDSRPADPPEEGSSPAAEPPRFGRVRGLVSDVRGDPLPGAVIALRREDSEWVRRQAVSDERGEFFLDDVQVGTWTVRHETRRPPVWERMAGIVGAIEVLEARETWVPVLLEGERRLTGTLRMNLEGFALQGDQGFLIDLQLRPEWNPDVAAARGSIHSFLQPPWKSGPRGGPPDPEDDLFPGRGAAESPSEDPPEWVEGSFRFENLRPGRYTLRILLEDNEWITTRIEGEQRRLHLYLEREVDLTLGDVELPPEQLDFWQDFVRTALERE